MKRFLALFVTAIVLCTYLPAQELKCMIQVNSDQVQGSNKAVFTALQKSASEFVNNRRWTDLTFASDERIDCSMTIIVKKQDGENITAEITVQSRRPVYNSAYNTTLFNFKDNDFNFAFKEFDILEVNENSITSNLTAVLSYYAYVIIGYDMDSYQRLGGTPYFQQAEQIVAMAQSASLSGWKAFESPKNRYALISNLTDETFKKYRNFFYDYHRLGLDQMSENLANARSKIVSELPILRESNRARPSSIIIATFFDAKTEELVQLLKGATDKEKDQSIEILSDVLPTQSEKFQSIKK